jgi:glutamate--cysteine ligase
MPKISEILLRKINANQQKVENFFCEKFQKNPPLFYNSFDIRHCGFKIAPVDANCFPAGFNNLCAASKKEAGIAAGNFFARNFPDAKKILILPESHTRNLPYLKNIFCLQQILGAEINAAKKEVIIGTLIPDLKAETNLEFESGRFVTLHPLIKKAGKILTLAGFEPDLIVLNNDLTDGIPEILQNVTIPVIPALDLGWYNRSKSHHFNIYNQLANELADILEIDPWLISSIHSTCHNLNFKEQKGLKNLSRQVDLIIENLQIKYRQYGICDEPYCYIKADKGTYGIAVWSVSSGAEVEEINKKNRNKMNMLKGLVPNTQVIIQEGIRTIDKIAGKIAEPMIYAINAQIIGNLFRVNDKRDEKISLNTGEASFFDLAELSESQLALGLEKNKIIIIYSLIARLGVLACAIENAQNKTIWS